MHLSPHVSFIYLFLVLIDWVFHVGGVSSYESVKQRSLISQNGLHVKISNTKWQHKKQPWRNNKLHHIEYILRCFCIKDFFNVLAHNKVNSDSEKLFSTHFFLLSFFQGGQAESSVSALLKGTAGGQSPAWMKTWTLSSRTVLLIAFISMNVWACLPC